MKIARDRRQLATLLWFAPSLAMLAIHWLFGFSDALLAYDSTKPKPPEWQSYYNLVMVVLFYASFAGFVVSNALFSGRNGKN